MLLNGPFDMRVYFHAGSLPADLRVDRHEVPHRLPEGQVGRTDRRRAGNRQYQGSTDKLGRRTEGRLQEAGVETQEVNEGVYLGLDLKLPGVLHYVRHRCTNILPALYVDSTNHRGYLIVATDQSLHPSLSDHEEASPLRVRADQVAMVAQVIGADIANISLIMFLVAMMVVPISKLDPESGCLPASAGGEFTYRVAQILLFVVFQIVQLPALCICYTIIVLKSSQDILQGISKLDYLMKVSVFQIEKG
eukprot:CAMPEP_0170509642 /NCGR_PEP_ID=MMETSP0208-20121228/65329_1 /TAXON_ID=197538 /ORGANISM="Strombidium inclinatum, Strain S3" /LENGTH=248 /DNA_ID=CAMNT_0010793023 /DNA_START=242 /DNA_END=985 /DNA_ORIENTATION=-